MREFPLFLVNHYLTGLRRQARQRTRAEALVQAKNLRIDRDGAEGFTPITDPFNGTKTVDFPWPQLFRGFRRTWLFFEGAVHLVDETTTPWTSIGVTPVEPSDGTTINVLTGSDVWHFADLFGTWFATNGTCVVFEAGLEELNGSGTLQLFNNDAVTFNSIDSFRGRFVFGGFNSANLWSSPFATMFSSWKGDITESFGANIDTDDIDGNWVMWSSIGGGDFPLWLFYPSYYTYNQAPTADIVIEKLRRNEFGWMPMRWKGDVQVVKSLRDHVIVYGTDGITALTPAPQQGYFGRTEILTGVGVPNRSAVGGDERTHIFMSTDGKLWRITNDLNVEKLDYSEFFSSFLGDSVAITLDPESRDFYIASGTAGYLLAEEQRLSEINQYPTSVTFLEGAVIGLFEEESGGDEDEVLVTTTPFDMGDRSIKTLTFIQLEMEQDIDPDPTVEVAVDYRYRKDEGWTRTAFILVNREGNAYLRVAGLEFRLVVKSDGFSGFRLDTATVRYQAGDRRARRGVSSQAINS